MRKLTPELQREVLGRAAEGASADEISAWLQAQHGVTISGRALRTRLAKSRTERADVTKAVVREKLTKTVISDLDRLEAIRVEVSDRASKISKSKRQMYAWTELKKLELKILDRRLHYAGADTPDEAATQIADAARTVASRIDRLAAVGGAGEAARGASAH